MSKDRGFKPAVWKRFIQQLAKKLPELAKSWHCTESVRLSKLIQKVINPSAVKLIQGKVIEWMLVESLLDEVASLVDKVNIFDVPDLFL